MVEVARQAPGGDGPSRRRPARPEARAGTRACRRASPPASGGRGSPRRRASARRRPSSAPSSAEATVPRPTKSTRSSSAACTRSASASRSARKSNGTEASQNVLYGRTSPTRGRSVEMPDLLQSEELAVLVDERDDHVLEPLRPPGVRLVRPELARTRSRRPGGTRRRRRSSSRCERASSSRTRSP